MRRLVYQQLYDARMILRSHWRRVPLLYFHCTRIYDPKGDWVGRSFWMFWSYLPSGTVLLILHASSVRAVSILGYGITTYSHHHNRAADLPCLT
jgi:hypothetical protein